MASSQDPKFIKIQHGEHSVSPHFTSHTRDSLNDGKHLTTNRRTSAPEEMLQPLSIQVNFKLPTEARPNKLARGITSLANKLPRIRLPHFEHHKKIQPAHRRKPAPEPEQNRTEFKRQADAPRFHISRIRASLLFVAVAFLIVTPLKAITTYQSLSDAKSNVEQLQSAAHGSVGKDFSAVGDLITNALRSFHNANASLSHIDGPEEFLLRHTPVIGAKFGIASRLVAAGEHTSLAAASYMQLFRTLKEKSDAPLIERLSMFFEGNRAVVSDLSAAADLVRAIDPTSLPEAQQKFVADARDAILALNDDAQYLSSAGPLILSTLGNSSPRRYLVVFQNPTELRPTGGFIGSFALVDIQNGEIKNLQVPPGGSYDLQGSLKQHVHSPIPLNVINSQWEFQDANWFPDFPASAQKLMWFLEKSQGPSVDGVIAINSTLLPELLAVVGPIKIPGSKTQLDEKNALTTVRDSIDVASLSNEKNPKQIIANAAPAVIETIKAGKSEHFLPVITTLLKALESRDIQIYAKDSDLEKQIADFGWDGSMRTNPSGDFLSVINTNIGGQKTDGLITQVIDHQAKISDDGTVQITVRISRSQRKSLRPFEGGPNVSYVRFYVPEGSKLTSALGFSVPAESMFQAPESWQKTDTDLAATEYEVGFDPASGTRITKEFNHSVFGNWMITKPDGKSEAIISYTLPQHVSPIAPTGLSKLAEALYGAPRPASYSVYIQRQSGVTNTELTSRVILPESWGLSWITDNRARIAENGAILTVPFVNDIYYGITAYAESTTHNQTAALQR